MKILTIEQKTLKNLQTFAHVEHMNETLRHYEEKYELNETDRHILKTISRYACKYIGVCYLRKKHIAVEAGFHSRRTAIRSCNRLEKIGIIKQYETRRLTGDRRQAPNIIVIQPIDQTTQKATTTETSTKQKAQRTKDEQLLTNRTKRQTKERHLKTPSQKLIIKRTPPSDFKQRRKLHQTMTKQLHATKYTAQRTNRFNDESHRKVTAESHPKETYYKTPNQTNTYIDTCKYTDKQMKRALKRQIPSEIFNALAPFFNGETLYDIYGILLRAKAKIDRTIRLEDFGEKYIDAFYNVLRLYKWGRVQNLENYLYATWESLTAQISRQIKWRMYEREFMKE